MSQSLPFFVGCSGKTRLPKSNMAPKNGGRPAVAVHCFNDFTLKMSTVVGLQASFKKNKCMFLCQWFILPSRDFKVLTIASKQ